MFLGRERHRNQDPIVSPANRLRLLLLLLFVVVVVALVVVAVAVAVCCCCCCLLFVRLVVVLLFLFSCPTQGWYMYDSFSFVCLLVVVNDGTLHDHCLWLLWRCCWWNKQQTTTNKQQTNNKRETVVSTAQRIVGDQRWLVLVIGFRWSVSHLVCCL